eukprot:705060-Pelagomonas_calceolata.AAC.1
MLSHPYTSVFMCVITPGRCESSLRDVRAPCAGQELLAQLAELGRRCGVGPGGVELAPQAPAT